MEGPPFSDHLKFQEAFGLVAPVVYQFHTFLPRESGVALQPVLGCASSVVAVPAHGEAARLLHVCPIIGHDGSRLCTAMHA